MGLRDKRSRCAARRRGGGPVCSAGDVRPGSPICSRPPVLDHKGKHEMTILATAGYLLAGLIAAAIIVVGARFFLAPSAAAAGYGIQPDLDQPLVGAYLHVKGIRDVASGVLVIIVMLAGN